MSEDRRDAEDSEEEGDGWSEDCGNDGHSLGEGCSYCETGDSESPSNGEFSDDNYSGYSD